MPGSSFKKRRSKAKSDRIYGGTGVAGKLNRIKPTQKIDTNRSTGVSQMPGDSKINQAHKLGQTPNMIENIEPNQEKPIKASDLFTFTKRTLSAEARELLAKIDEGGIPVLVTQNLERIAKENGIEISNKMTPDDIIRRLRKLA